MNKTELFDMDQFMDNYAEMSWNDLTGYRTEIGFWLSDYQKAPHTVPSDETLFAEFQDKKIEYALLSKLIHMKMLAEVFPCPNCGLLCGTEQTKCHQCGRKLN